MGAQAEDGSSAIIYRYPEEAAPPPPEVADFCLPLGSRLEYIRPEDEEAKAEEIFYGLNTGSGEHLSRCFIFMLEDKSGGAGAAAGGAGEELGVDASRLYGVCVAHPRLLRVRLEEEGGPEGDGDGFYSFESQVCYAFVTRFPFFEFFFTAINSMILAEKLERMERKNSSLLSGSLGGSSGGEEEDLFAHYRYVPTSLIEAVLQRVKHLPPPRFNSDLSIEFIRGVPAVHLLRPRPTLDFPEHMQHAVNWALPTLVRRYLPAPRDYCPYCSSPVAVVAAGGPPGVAAQPAAVRGEGHRGGLRGGHGLGRRDEPARAAAPAQLGRAAHPRPAPQVHRVRRVARTHPRGRRGRAGRRGRLDRRGRPRPMRVRVPLHPAWYPYCSALPDAASVPVSGANRRRTRRCWT